MTGIDLKDGEVIVRKTSPGVRLASGRTATSGVTALPDIPEGAVSALVQPSVAVRFKKGGDADEPSTTEGIKIAADAFFPVNGSLEDARFRATGSEGTLDVEYYGDSE